MSINLSFGGVKLYQGLTAKQIKELREIEEERKDTAKPISYYEFYQGGKLKPDEVLILDGKDLEIAAAAKSKDFNTTMREIARLSRLKKELKAGGKMEPFRQDILSHLRSGRSLDEIV